MRKILRACYLAFFLFIQTILPMSSMVPLAKAVECSGTNFFVFGKLSGGVLSEEIGRGGPVSFSAENYPSGVYVAYPISPADSGVEIHWCWRNTQGLGSGTSSCGSNALLFQVVDGTTIARDANNQLYAVGRFNKYDGSSKDIQWEFAPWKDNNNACGNETDRMSLNLNKTNTCQWNIERGKLTFCMGGFSSAEELQRSKVSFYCTTPLCNLRSGLQGGRQVTPLTNPVRDSKSGTYYTCVAGDFDSSVQSELQSQINRLNNICEGVTIAGGIGAIIVTGGIAGATAIGYGAALAAGTAVPLTACEAALNGKEVFNFTSEVQDASGAPLCRRDVTIKMENITANNEGKLGKGDLPDPSDVGGNSEIFDLCGQINDPDKRQECISCAGGAGGVAAKDDNVNGIWTALGCIPTSQEGVINAVVKTGLGLSGGIVLILFAAGGLLISTSKGTPKQADQGKELITSAIIGLLFIIFSVSILQYIGVNIMQIPGFGS